MKSKSKKNGPRIGFMGPKFLGVFFFIFFSDILFAQELISLSEEDQPSFYQGYWKYVNPDDNEIFILKIKALRRQKDRFDASELGANSYIASMLYCKNDSIIVNRLSDLNRFLGMTDRAEVSVVFEQEHYNVNIITSEYDINTGEVVLKLSDPVNADTDGRAYLTIISSSLGNEQVHWRLKLPECVIEDLKEGMTEEEFIQRYMTFTIPSDMILTKMHNLREFRSKGIILDPIPELHQ